MIENQVVIGQMEVVVLWVVVVVVVDVVVVVHIERSWDVENT